jgi:hypothetical protein
MFDKRRPLTGGPEGVISAPRGPGYNVDRPHGFIQLQRNS